MFLTFCIIKRTKNVTNFVSFKHIHLSADKCDHKSLPFLLAGEKKLKTGEKMVPRRVVRGGLLGVSVCTSSFPLGFTGLLCPVMVSEQKKMRNI